MNGSITPALGYLVAHQGGWDEMLFVAVPLIVFAALLALARRRVDTDSGSVDVELTADQDVETDP